LNEADVPALAELATRLNVESFVQSSLGRLGKGLGPAAAAWLDGLRRQVMASMTDNLRRDAELSEPLDRLGGEGIGLILLKGSALRLEAPGRAGRFQCDVDALVRREDLERAEAILLEMGFRLDGSYLDREELLRRHFHFAFERRGAVVELHWDLDHASPPGFVDRLWRESRTLEADGRSWRVLSPQHHLLFGCLHLSRHGFHGGLRWLADLRSRFPMEPGVAAAFEEEARAWPSRPVRCPLWALGELGVPEARVLAGKVWEGDRGADPVERALLRRFLVPLLLAEPWLGIPSWRLEHALRAWLFSERSLPALLAEYSGQGMSSRLRAWAGGVAEEGV
jgi:hypothetical protein